MKKLITFALVLVMLLSIFALPAMAATNDVEPRYPVLRCGCGGTAVYAGVNGNGQTIFECQSCGNVITP